MTADRLSRLTEEFSKFCMIGAAAYVVDVGLFNVLIHAGVTLSWAKTASVVAATTWAYVGNRRWAFRHRGSRRDRIGAPGEYVLFFAVNGVGLLMALACLAVSQDVLGYTSALSQNIAANGVGFALGLLFRFWAYRAIVFPAPDRDQRVDSSAGAQDARGPVEVSR